MEQIGRKKIIVSYKIFCHLFSHGSHAGYTVTKDPIPKDATIIDVKHNGFENCFEILIESKEFPKNVEGEPYPILSPVVIVEHFKTEGVTA